MPELILAPMTARPALMGASAQIGGATLGVIADKSLFVLGIVNAKALGDGLGALPGPGQSVVTPHGAMLWSGAQEVMVFVEGPAVTEADLARRISASGQVTEVTDGWVVLSLRGARARALLDHIVLPDLSGDNFAVGAVVGTKLGHVRVLIWQRTADEVLILAPSSYSGALWHCLTTELGQAARHREFRR